MITELTRNNIINYFLSEHEMVIIIIIIITITKTIIIIIIIIIMAAWQLYIHVL